MSFCFFFLNFNFLQLNENSSKDKVFWCLTFLLDFRRLGALLVFQFFQLFSVIMEASKDIITYFKVQNKHVFPLDKQMIEGKSWIFWVFFFFECVTLVCQHTWPALSFFLSLLIYFSFFLSYCKFFQKWSQSEWNTHGVYSFGGRVIVCHSKHSLSLCCFVLFLKTTYTLIELGAVFQHQNECQATFYLCSCQVLLQVERSPVGSWVNFWSRGLWNGQTLLDSSSKFSCTEDR